MNEVNWCSIDSLAQQYIEELVVGRGLVMKKGRGQVIEQSLVARKPLFIGLEVEYNNRNRKIREKAGDESTEIRIESKSV